MVYINKRLKYTLQSLLKGFSTLPKIIDALVAASDIPALSKPVIISWLSEKC